MPGEDAPVQDEPPPSQQSPEAEDGDLSDMLEELRILLPGTTTLTAFLIILPFNAGFSEIRDQEKVIYVITFLCCMVSLALFTAPAAHHRLQRPLRDREGFKNRSTRLMIAGLIPLSIALVLASQLVLSEVFATAWLSWSAAGGLALLILALWWIYPTRKQKEQQKSSPSRRR
jgi:magnesium-transporting ATPase (P-type)